MTQQQPRQEVQPHHEELKTTKRRAVFDLLDLEHDLEAQEHETPTRTLANGGAA